jgi:hypothetical protein
MEAPVDIIPSVEMTADKHDDPAQPKAALTPPTSEDLGQREERLSSELSELVSDDDDEEIEPDHYFEGGKIPVFKPVGCDPFLELESNATQRPQEDNSICSNICCRQWTSSEASRNLSIKLISMA